MRVFIEFLYTLFYLLESDLDQPTELFSQMGLKLKNLWINLRFMLGSGH